MSDFTAKMHQIQFRLALHPDPAGGAYSALPDSLASPLPEASPLHSALRSSILRPPGYNDSFWI